MTARKSPSDIAATRLPLRTTLLAHLRIARVDHWFKNVFVLPGIVAAASTLPDVALDRLLWNVVRGLAAVCLVASSNYVINEVMDAPFDRHHPTKRYRPVPSGKVNIWIAYAQWLLLMLAGVALGATVSVPLAATLLALWIMGCLYNLPPIRTKDVPYVDVLSEAVNNPIRMLAGWFMVAPMTIPPASLLLSYWMVGCYFMALKRFSEYHDIQAGAGRAADYRKSFGYYNSQRLLVSVTFYGSAAMLFFGAFIMRYRLELIVSFPLVALIMAMYLDLSFRKNSPVAQPEKLYREPLLMAAVAGCTLLITVLLFLDIPLLYRIFAPTVPTSFSTGWRGLP